MDVMQDLDMKNKLTAAIDAKLVGLFVPESANDQDRKNACDYVMVMLANKRPREVMKDSLKLMLGENTHEFLDWLFEVVYKLESATLSGRKKTKHEDTDPTKNHTSENACEKSDVNDRPATAESVASDHLVCYVDSDVENESIPQLEDKVKDCQIKNSSSSSNSSPLKRSANRSTFGDKKKSRVERKKNKMVSQAGSVKSLVTRMDRTIWSDEEEHGFGSVASKIIVKRESKAKPSNNIFMRALKDTAADYNQTPNGKGQRNGNNSDVGSTVFPPSKFGSSNRIASRALKSGASISAHQDISPETFFSLPSVASGSHEPRTDTFEVLSNDKKNKAFAEVNPRMLGKLLTKVRDETDDEMMNANDEEEVENIPEDIATSVTKKNKSPHWQDEEGEDVAAHIDMGSPRPECDDGDSLGSINSSPVKLYNLPRKAVMRPISTTSSEASPPPPAIPPRRSDDSTPHDSHRRDFKPEHLVCTTDKPMPTTQYSSETELGYYAENAVCVENVTRQELGLTRPEHCLMSPIPVTLTELEQKCHSWVYANPADVEKARALLAGEHVMMNLVYTDSATAILIIDYLNMKKRLDVNEEPREMVVTCSDSMITEHEEKRRKTFRRKKSIRDASMVRCKYHPTCNSGYMCPYWHDPSLKPSEQQLAPRPVRPQAIFKSPQLPPATVTPTTYSLPKNGRSKFQPPNPPPAVISPKPCRRFPNCGLAAKCELKHPNCKDGSDCSDNLCVYEHRGPSRGCHTLGQLRRFRNPKFAFNSIDRTAMPVCKFGDLCRNRNCIYTHRYF